MKVGKEGGQKSYLLPVGQSTIPIEVRMPAARVEEFNAGINDEALILNLDLLQEKREPNIKTHSLIL